MAKWETNIHWQTLPRFVPDPWCNKIFFAFQFNRQSLWVGMVWKRGSEANWNVKNTLHNIDQIRHKLNLITHMNFIYTIYIYVWACDLPRARSFKFIYVFLLCCCCCCYCSSPLVWYMFLFYLPLYSFSPALPRI